MNEKNGKNPLLALTVVTVFFTTLGVIFYSQAPFKGGRPPVPDYKEPPGKIRARLWQDPFQAVLDYEKTREVKGKPDGAAPKQVASKDRRRQTPNKTRQSKAEQTRPGLGVDEGSIDFSASCQLQGSLRQEIDNRLKRKEDVTVLGVMVFGGPYAELVEFRLRQRYAVLSALNRLHYYPSDPEHIRYLRIINNGDDNNQITLSDIVPFEWLNKENQEENRIDSILLLWLNEDSFYTSPLENIACLKRHFQFNQSNLPFKLIGPPSSTILLKIIKKLDDDEFDKEKSLSGLGMYCTTATADDPSLLPGFKKDTRDISEERRIEARETLIQKFKKKGVTFSRTICSDGELVAELIEELRRRGVDLAAAPDEDHVHPKNPSEKVQDPYGGHRHHIVLLSEWDTDYGRLLPETFLEVLKAKHNEGLTEDSKRLFKIQDIKWVHRFSYLRGVDGKLPGELNGGAKEQKKEEAAGKEDKDVRKLEEPLGRSQYDYIRRSAETISRLEDHLRFKGSWSITLKAKGSIKAIGVMGNDFYDKFLVLQALGQRFPDRVFFTTDLDACYLHPANTEWTRNLVVASTFDLQLREDIQGDVPPFRDSYQTSVFLATLKALYNGKDTYNPLKPEDINQPLKPRIFEIGRRNAVDLTALDEDKKEPKDKYKPPNRAPKPLNLIEGRELPVFIYFSIIFVILLYLCVFHRKYYLYIFGLIFFVASYFYLISEYFLEKEPLFVIEGISIWPTELIQIVAMLLSWVFIIVSLKSLRKNREELDKEFFSKDKMEAGPNTLIRERNDTVNYFWKKYTESEGSRRQWLLIILVSFGFLAISFYLVQSFGEPFTPLRGIKYCLGLPKIHLLVLLPTLFSFNLLTFFVLYDIRLCRWFITEIMKGQCFFDQKSLKEFGVKSGTSEISQKALSDLLLVRLIGKRTEIVGKLIFFPFIIWFLLFISRHYYFDNWRTPLGLAIVISMSALLAWTCAFILRQSAENLRAVVVDRLTKQLDGAYATEPLSKIEMDRVQYVLKEVKDIKSGAFASYLQQPVLQSLLVPLGSISGLKVLEFLANLG